MKLFVILLFILTLTVGCKSPISKWLSITKQEDKTEQKVSKNKEETVEKARSFIHGTETALSLNEEPNKYTEVAQDLNKRAGLTLGETSYENAIVMDRIVAGLLSTNTQIKAKAEKDLKTKDSEVISLQDKLSVLEGKLRKIEKEKEDIAAENTGLAQKWHTLVKWVKFIFWGIIIVVVLALASQVLSVVAPEPYKSIFSIVALAVGWLIRMILSLFPNSKKYAKIVPQEEYQKSENTLKSIVDAIQDIRNKEIKPEDITPKATSLKIKDLIDSTLKEVTNKEDRIKIAEVKKTLGYI